MTGVDLAYELAKKGDSKMANLLKIYQELLAAIADLTRPSVAKRQKPATIKSLTSAAENMRERLEKSAAEKAILILAASPVH